jgi:hypothetical protein
MNVRASNLAFGFILSAISLLAETHADSGLVIETNAKSHSILVSCAEIPGYMAPMEMWFKVRLPADIDTLKPGMQIRFNIVTSGHDLYAEQIKQEASENFESEPMQAGGLTAISSALDPKQAATVVKVGDPVPDFTLTDQSGEQIHLSQFRNKVVALTFGYSRCPTLTTAGACRTTLPAWNVASQVVLGATSSFSPLTSIPNTTMEKPSPTLPRYGAPIRPNGISCPDQSRR